MLSLPRAAKAQMLSWNYKGFFDNIIMTFTPGYAISQNLGNEYTGLATALQITLI